MASKCSNLLSNLPAVIFATAFDEYAIKAFERHAVDYLLKPFSKERFSKAIENWFAQRGTQQQKKATETLLLSTNELPAQAERIVVKTGGKIKIIPVAELQYVEAADDYVKLYTKDGNFLKNKTMAFFEQTLNSLQFVRTHRSYIINSPRNYPHRALRKRITSCYLKIRCSNSGKQNRVCKTSLGVGLIIFVANCRTSICFCCVAHFNVQIRIPILLLQSRRRRPNNRIFFNLTLTHELTK
jgi:CheY-like chemotaxis protein